MAHCLLRFYLFVFYNPSVKVNPYIALENRTLSCCLKLGEIEQNGKILWISTIRFWMIYVGVIFRIFFCYYSREELLILLRIAIGANDFFFIYFEMCNFFAALSWRSEMPIRLVHYHPLPCFIEAFFPLWNVVRALDDVLKELATSAAITYNGEASLFLSLSLSLFLAHSLGSLCLELILRHTWHVGACVIYFAWPLTPTGGRPRQGRISRESEKRKIRRK